MEQSAFSLYAQCWRQFFQLKGTLSKKDYWSGCIPFTFLFYVIYLLIWGVWAGPITGALSPVGIQVFQSLSYVFLVVFFIPWFTASVRRLRDAGINPWWSLLSFLVFTIIVVLVMAGTDGKRESR